jgi:hypothetical protein
MDEKLHSLKEREKIYIVRNKRRANEKLENV